MKEVIASGKSTKGYYESYNSVYEEAFGHALMLHYPYFKKKGESLEGRQVNLTELALSHLTTLNDKEVLEIGCGNGVQSIYISEKFNVKNVTGVDINQGNINVALRLGEKHSNVQFLVDNAQELASIANSSVDVLVCIESAFHYPDKQAFINQVHRVLKEKGEFVITDILNKKKNKIVPLKSWGKRMSMHHWTISEYEDAIGIAKLKLLKKENINREVIMGFEGHRRWIDRKNFESSSRYRTIHFFAVIQCAVIIFLLKHRRRYYLLHGTKSTD